MTPAVFSPLDAAPFFNASSEQKGPRRQPQRAVAEGGKTIGDVKVVRVSIYNSSYRVG